MARLLTRFMLIILVSCCASTLLASDPPADETQHILVNLAPGHLWHQSAPEKLKREHLETIKTTLGDDPGARRRIGIGLVFSYLRNPPDKPLDGALRYSLRLAGQTDTPIVVQFDGENWWQGRPDLWNWWDPDQPGYDPVNRLNVEWTGWGPEHAIKIAWRNWGRQIRVLPPPNLMSPAYRKANREELRRLAMIVNAWRRQLPPSRKHLLVGVKVGHESSIGVNAWYYPNGNDLLEKPPHDDPKRRLDHDDPVSRGVTAIGYAAVSTAGLRSEGELTEKDLVEVVRRHVHEISKTTADAGIPREKLFTHGAGWKEGELLYNTAVNEFSCPGWSFYRHAGDPRKDTGVQRALRNSTAPGWAAVEWLYMGSRETDRWREALENTLADPRCRFVCIFNWRSIKDHPSIHEAIRQVVNDSLPLASQPAP